MQRCTSSLSGLRSYVFRYGRILSLRPLSLGVLLISAVQFGILGVAYGQAVRPFEPLGLRLGAFTLFPTLRVSEIYETNVGLEANNETSDFVTLIQPDIALKSVWSVHSLELTTGAELAIHANESEEDSENVFARADARIDVTRATNFEFRADAARQFIGRDDPEDEDNDLVDFLRYGSTLGLNHQFVRLAISSDIGFQRDNFPAGEEDRDATRYNLGLRTDYRIGRDLDLFVEGRYNIEDRDEDVDDAGIERDGRGYEIRLGASQDINALVSGEAFVGYRLQQFDEPEFGDESGLSFGADLAWRPTLLTTIAVAGERDLKNTNQADVASNFRTTGSITLTHELRRYITLGTDFSYTRDDFLGDDRADDTFEAGFSTTYKMNRWIGLDAGYSYLERTSTDDNQEFQAHRIRIGLALQL